jgi:hypothetical protein
MTVLLRPWDIAAGPVKAAIAGKGQSIATFNSQFSPRILRVKDVRDKLPIRQCVIDLTPCLPSVY